jgi:hypothetical protein
MPPCRAKQGGNERASGPRCRLRRADQLIFDVVAYGMKPREAP